MYHLRIDQKNSLKSEWARLSWSNIDRMFLQQNREDSARSISFMFQAPPLTNSAEWKSIWMIKVGKSANGQRENLPSETLIRDKKTKISKILSFLSASTSWKFLCVEESKEDRSEKRSLANSNKNHHWATDIIPATRRDNLYLHFLDYSFVCLCVCLCVCVCLCGYK